MRIATPLWALTSLALLATAPAHADSLSATRDQELDESKHSVRVSVRDGVATYRVRRTFHNAGTLHEEAVLALGLPFGAAATGLRIKTPSGWYEGHLMRAEQAAALYQELTGFGPHTVKDPALLSWRWANELELRVFPVPPAGESTLEYTLTGPTRYQGGHYIVSYPRGSLGLAPPVLEVVGHNEGSPVWLDGQLVTAGEPTPLDAPEHPSWAPQGKLPGTFAVSEITIAEALRAKKLSVAVDVRHTYRGDLTVELVPPKGPWRTLVARDGGGENDIRRTFEVVLSKDEAESVKGVWRLVVSDAAALDVGSIDGWSITLAGGPLDKKLVALDVPRFIPDAPSGEAGNMVSIEVAAPPIKTVAARLGRVEASASKQFVRLEIDAAPALGKIPDDLHVVFVVDASKSVSEMGLAEQLSLLRSYLSHVPKAQVEVVLYRRHAERLFGSFAAAPDVEALLAKAEKDGRLALGNGSALEEGIRGAGAALRAQPGSHRIVMLSDDLLRPTWQREAAQALLDRMAPHIAHVVLPQLWRAEHVWSGDGRDQRDDGHPLASLAHKSGGILLRVDRPGDANKELDDVTLGLVRPIRIDNFRVLGLALPAAQALPTVLHEGEGVREMALLPKAPGAVTLTGKIWSRSFSRAVEGPLRFSQATAAFVFSHDMHRELSPAEMLNVALAGKVVSPVTSYLAVEPGVRPSQDGLRLSGVGDGGGGRGEGIGLGGIGTIGHGAGHCPAYSIKADVEKAVAACRREGAPPSGWKLSVTVDTTFDEVVDVTANQAPESTLSRCIANAVWGAELSGCQFTKRRDRVVVTWP